MKNNREEINPDKTARVAGFVFLIIFCLGVSAELFIRPDIIVPGDAARTVNNIMASASLMVIFALVGVSISMLNELNDFAALLLSSGADYLKAFGANQSQALVLFFLDLRKYGTFISQVFSFWVLLLGYLVFKSGFLPRILGILLMLGGLCLTGQAVLFFLFPNFDATIFGLFAFIGELLFYLLLLIKGVNVEQWKKRTLESAGTK